MCNILLTAICNLYSICYTGTKMDIEALCQKYYVRKGGFTVISYEPLWNTMEQKKITKYHLIYHWGISSNTLRRMSHNEAISTTTLNQLCLILECKVDDILKFEPTPEELDERETTSIKIRKSYKKNKP